MSNATTFDDLDNGTTGSGHGKPIWTLELDPAAPDYDAKKIVSWLRDEIAHLRNVNNDRFEEIKRNVQLYKGLQYLSQTSRTDTRDKNVKAMVEKIVVNELWDLTQNKVSRLVKYKPAVSVLPHDTDPADKVAAKANKALLDHIWYVQNYEEHVERLVAQYAKVMGEMYLWIEWNPNRGDLHPSSKKLLDEGEDKVELLDENDEPVKDDNGKPVTVSAKKRVGDVEYTLKTPMESLLQRVKRIEDVEYGFKIEVMHVERAKRKYPDCANKIKGAHVEVYDWERMELVTKADHVEIFHFYHLPIEEWEAGGYLVLIGEELAAHKEYPYSKKDRGIGNTDLPVERFTDEELPEELHGRSFLARVKGLTGTVNNLTNMILRNQYLVSHPKWMLPNNSADVSQLGNDITIVRYKGPVAPQLVQANPTPAEVFNFRQLLKEEARQHAGFGPITRGEPPPGVKAFVALQYLGEQENDRANEEIVKWNAFRRNTAQKTLGVCGDYYDPDDERFIRVMGRNRAWMKEKYEAQHLKRGYDVEIQNTSALPQERSARNQTLVELKKEFPTLFPDEQFLDLLGFSESEKFMDIATTSVLAAEMENDELMQGKPVKPPEDYESLMLHWRIHARIVQEYQFKHFTPEPTQRGVIEHIRATEMLMAEKARTNPKFQAQLLELELFPLFYKDELLSEPSPEMEEAGQAETPPGAAPLPDVNGAVANALGAAAGAPTNPAPGTAPEAEVGPNGAPPEANATAETVGKPEL